MEWSQNERLVQLLFLKFQTLATLFFFLQQEFQHGRIKPDLLSSFHTLIYSEDFLFN